MEETEIFRLFEECARWSWNTVSDWNWFAQRSVGLQLVKAVDSINANLVEGDGRYSSADALHFFVIARASAREARLWIWRAEERKLISSDACAERVRQLESAGRQLNRLISYRRANTGNLYVKEVLATYDDESSDPFAEDFEF